LGGVFTLRTMADVSRLKPAMQPGAKLVVIGGGYVGLETGAMAKKLGLDVSVVEAAPRILARVAGEETAAEIAALHARNGVNLLTGVGLAGFEGQTHVTGVRLVDGRVLPADIVLLAVGAVPNVELAAAAGIALDNGIATDAATRTNLPDIYAAGDCASFPSARYGRRLRLESVQNAIDSAKAAAGAMLGGSPVYDPVPWFWSDQFDLKLQIAGLSTGATRVEREINDGKGAIRAYLGDRLIAVDSLNDPKSHLIARKTLAEASGSARAA
jgi:3-phenylpropionate/trans-cinnamate dioxygenase ferredoxin reductase subunit